MPQMKESKSSYFKRIGKLFSFNYYTELIALFSVTIISIVLGRVLDASVLGIYSVIFITATFFRMTAESGYDYQILTEIPNNQSQVYNLMLESQKSKNLLLTLTLPFMIIYLHFSTSDLNYLLIIPYNYLSSLTYNFKTVARALNLYNKISKVESIYSILLLLIVIPLIYFFKNLSLILIAFILLEILKILLLKNVVQNKEEIKIPTYAQLFKISINYSSIKNTFHKLILRKDYVLLNLNTVLQNRMAFFVLGLIGTSAEKGIYTAAYRFITFARSIPWALLSILLPDFSKQIKNGELVDLKIGILVAAFVGFIVSLPLFILSDWLIEITFKFGVASDILKILSWSFIAIMMNTVLESFLVAAGKNRTVNNTLLITILFTVLSSSILYKYFNIYGIAYSYLISEIIIFILFFFKYLNSKKENL